jgi:hypothetical protein
LFDIKLKDAFAPAPPTCAATGCRAQLLASHDEGRLHQGEAKTDIIARRSSFRFDPAAEACD